MSIIPKKVDLTNDNAIPQGATYVRDFNITASGAAYDFSAIPLLRCNFRNSATDGTATFQPTMAFVGATSLGVIRMTITPSMTTSVNAQKMKGVYDVEAYTSTGTSTVERVFGGDWKMTPEVTKTST